MNFGNPQNTGLHPRCNVCQILLQFPPEVPESCSLPLVIDLAHPSKNIQIPKNSFFFFPEEYNSAR